MSGTMLSNKDNYIVWMDMEMTGIDPKEHTILEVACVISDGSLNIVSEEFHVIINQPDVILNNMNEWCMNQHTKTGLAEASRLSKISLIDAEQLLLAFLKKYIPESTCPLAGNTIYIDRIFLAKFMPLVNDYLHYRIIDVSSIKELARRWNLQIYECQPKKERNHTAVSDIRESIQELKYYKENIFICSAL